LIRYVPKIAPVESKFYTLANILELFKLDVLDLMWRVALFYS